MKITITGGSGFLGSHVADELSRSGHKVIIFDKKRSPYLQDQQNMIKGDILDLPQVLDAVIGADVVYNFAGIPPSTFINSPVINLDSSVTKNSTALATSSEYPGPSNICIMSNVFFKP